MSFSRVIPVGVISAVAVPSIFALIVLISAVLIGITIPVVVVTGITIPMVVVLLIISGLRIVLLPIVTGLKCLCQIILYVTIS